MCEIGPQGLQVAVVDADHSHTELQGAIQLGPVVHFHEHVEAELGGGRRQLVRHRIGQRRHDQQDAIGPDPAAFDDLIRVEDEILAQDRQPAPPARAAPRSSSLPWK